MAPSHNFIARWVGLLKVRLLAGRAGKFSEGGAGERAGMRRGCTGEEALLLVELAILFQLGAVGCHLDRCLDHPCSTLGWEAKLLAPRCL
eukprot:10398203-Alexandrium_andersonii.AAC.1